MIRRLLHKLELRPIGISVIALSLVMLNAPLAHATGRGIEVASMPAYAGYWDSQWSTLLGSTGSLPSKVVLNVDNGDATFDSNWQTLAHELHQKGIEVLGYVYTDYGQRSEANVEASIDNYFPSGAVAGDTAPDGILFDEFGTVGTNGQLNCDGMSYYNDVVGHAYGDLATSGGEDFDAHIWANSGTAVPSCYLGMTEQIDTFVTAENNETNYDTYVPYNVLNSNGTFSSGSGTYPSWRFAHVVYCVPSTDIDSVVDRAYDNYAGYVYTTNDGCSPDTNPYDTFPSNTYLNSEVTYGETK